MPLFEYECSKCGHRFEKIHKFVDRSIKTCPKCGGKVARLPSAPAIQFKGSGWYITDYARKGQTDGEDKSSKSGDEKSSKSGDEKSSKPSEDKSSKVEKSSKEEKPSKEQKASKASKKKGSED